VEAAPSLGARDPTFLLTVLCEILGMESRFPFSLPRPDTSATIRREVTNISVPQWKFIKWQLHNNIAGNSNSSASEKREEIITKNP
jgi:hypothetical protein